MKIFGYGSLMCEDSFRKTIDSFEVLGQACLPGYRRVFNLKSWKRKNPETGNYSSVLNLKKDEASTVCGMTYDVPESIVEALHMREKGYGMRELSFDDGSRAFAYIAEVDEPYHYIENDSIQKEYLDICLKAAKNLGEEMYENFLDSTYIKDKSLSELRDKIKLI